MSDCPRKGKWIGGCRFEGRWDYPAAEPPSYQQMVAYFHDDRPSVVAELRPKKYVRDLCIRCGKIIEREKA